MAKDKVVKRGVYLYLDGSEIKNDIKSVEAEMKGLISAQKKMTIGSEEYVRTAQKIRSLRGIINEHNAQLREVETNVKKNSISIGKLADGFNRFFGLIGAGLAALTGFTLALRSLRDEKNKLEESQAGLKALTGLDDDSIAWLTGQAKKLSTSMTKEGLRVRQSANEILDAYMLIGSAKPELLGNKEALAAVTEEAMRLQAAAKDITLNEAVDALTLSLNQYSEGADKAAKFTNVLAAGSQAGSANIASEAKAIRVAGVAAASANTSIEHTVGLIQTLAYRGIKDEIAGTGLKKFFLTLQTGSDETNPKIVGLTTALDNLKKKQMDAAAIKKMFGEEGYNVASVLINETEQVKQFTKAVTGTNIATEQAAINSNTAAAKLAQAKNELKLAGIELAERLNPAMAVSTNMLTNLIKYLPSLIDWLKEWGRAIVLLTGSVLAYGAVVKAVNIYQSVSNTLMGAARVLSLKLTIAKLAETTNFTRLAAATKLYNAEMAKSNIVVTAGIRITNLFKALLYSLQVAYYTLTFQVGKAKGAMVAFNMVSKMNPYALLVSAIIAVGAAIYLLTRRVSASVKAQKDLNEINKKVGEGIAEEKSKIDLLLFSIHNSNAANEKRISAINELKKIIPGYNAEISREGTIINENTEAIKAYMIQLEKEMRMSAASEKMRELYRQQFESREKVNVRKTKLAALEEEYSKQDKSSPDYGGYRAMGRSSNIGAVRSDLKKEEQELKDIDTRIENLKSYYGSLIESSSSLVETRTIKSVTAELKNAQEVLEKLKNTNTEMFTPGELIVYNDKLKTASFSTVKLQTELKKLNEEKKKGGSAGIGDGDKKDAVKRIEDTALAKRVALMAEYAIGKKDYITYREELKLIESESISKQMSLYKKGSAEYNSLREKQINADIEKSKYAAERDAEVLEWSYAEDLRLLDEQRASGIMTKEEYQNKLMELDIDYLMSKRSLYDKGSKEYEQVEKEIAKRLSDEQLRRQKEVLNKIDELRTKYQVKSLRGMYEQEMSDLKVALDAKLITYEKYEKERHNLRMIYAKKGMNPDDLSSGTEKPDQKKISFFDAMFSDLGDRRKAAVEELKKAYEEGRISTEEYLQGLSESWGTYLSGVCEKVQAAYAVINSVVSAYSNFLQASQDADIAKVEKRYEAEINAAGDNSAKVKRLEEKKEKEIAQIKSEYADRAFGIQVAQALAQTAIGAINAFSSAAAVPLIGYILAPIAAAAALASGMVQVAAIKKQKEAAKVGYMSGGFTKSGRPDEEQGVVHSNEFVANRFAVSNPRLRPFFNLIDYAQRTNSVGNLTADDVSSVMGGNVTKGLASSSRTVVSTEPDTDKFDLVSALNKSSMAIEMLYKRLNDPFVTINTVDGPYGIKKAMDDYDRLQRNKSR